MTNEEKELTDGNILISKYMFGEPERKTEYQIGFRSLYPIYRYTDHLSNSFYDNFHNNWNLLMTVIAKIAKQHVDDFSDEDIIVGQIKSCLFHYAYEPMIVWREVVRYVKLKLII